MRHKKFVQTILFFSNGNVTGYDWYIQSKIDFINEKIAQKLSALPKIRGKRSPIRYLLQKILGHLQNQSICDIKIGSVPHGPCKIFTDYIKLLQAYLANRTILGRSKIMTQVSELETAMIVPKRLIS